MSLNTALYAHPALATEIAQRHGVQCVVASIDVRGDAAGGWRCFSHAGKHDTGREVIAWARELEDRGAGEILVTSIERDGTMQGYDQALIEAVVAAVNIPVIASGGCRKLPAHGRCRDEGRRLGRGRGQHVPVHRTDPGRRQGRAGGGGVPVRRAFVATDA